MTLRSEEQTPARRALRIQRTKGVIAMTEEEFRAELEKPVATIKLNVELLRQAGVHFRIDSIDPFIRSCNHD